MTLVERFLKYVSFPTTSGEDREGKCSTDGQYVLAEELKKELSELGLTDISSNEYCWHIWIPLLQQVEKISSHV